jgi:predicted dehydrogenase
MRGVSKEGLGASTGSREPSLASRLGPSGFDPARGWFPPPSPNSQTEASFEEIIAWATAVAEGRWSWVRNSKCKYVTLHIDTRSGAYRIDDRDDQRITLTELVSQYRRDSDGSGEAVETPESDSIEGDSAGLQGIAQTPPVSSQWQTIDSAPKDGTRFIAAWECESSGQVCVSTDVYWWRDRWISEDAGLIEPYAWQPLPTPAERVAK